MRIGEALGLQFPDAFPPLAAAADQPSVGQHIEVLGDGLAGDRRVPNSGPPA